MTRARQNLAAKQQAAKQQAAKQQATWNIQGFLRAPPGWALAAALLVLTMGLGAVSGAFARYVFILGCCPLGYYAWRQGPAAHLQTMLCLLCFAPFARRVVDLFAGYDPIGIMLTGSFLALLVPAATLQDALLRKPFANDQIYPICAAGACMVYAAALTIFQGDVVNAASGTLKALTPLIYAMCILLSDERPEAMLEAMASAFLVILPIMGLYGLYQYIDPPPWDILWMKMASIMSAGQPVPYGVRTFSTMNGPAGFATFAGLGLFLALFLRPGWLTLVLSTPAAISFLLSSYRTAWIALAAAIGFCLLFSTTRARALGAVGAGAGMVLLTLQTPFSAVVTDRFASLTEGSNDGSARERMEQFVSLWNAPNSNLFGIGYSTVDVGTAGAMAVDGLFVTCWLIMGFAVGLICIATSFYACIAPISDAWRRPSQLSIIVGALAVYFMANFPLANVISGEFGVLFWTCVILLMGPQRLSSNRLS